MRCYLSVIKLDKKMASDASKILLPSGVAAGKLVHLALPVRYARREWRARRGGTGMHL
jgi:hypothetical protein